MANGPNSQIDDAESLTAITVLEARIDAAADVAQIDPDQWQEFRRELNDLKEHHPDSYAHCLRVGLYAYGLAVAETQPDVKLPLFGGAGHDMGKCDIDVDILGSSAITEAQMAIIRRHPHDGQSRWGNRWLFTGLVAGLHHASQPNGYGIDLDEIAPPFVDSIAKAKILAVAELVRICDFFDALTTRRNQKGLVSDPSDEDQIRLVMNDHFPGQSQRVEWLIAQRRQSEPVS